jgi:hypothetical protein
MADLPVRLSLGITAAKKIVDVRGERRSGHPSCRPDAQLQHHRVVPVEVFWYIVDGGPVAKDGFIDLSDTAPGFGLTLRPVDANFKPTR